VGLPPLAQVHIQEDYRWASARGGKPETWKWFRLKGVRNPSGKV
jgi:hypothetical protein